VVARRAAVLHRSPLPSPVRGGGRPPITAEIARYRPEFAKPFPRSSTVMTGTNSTDASKFR
jgi:hypothetical protein